MLEEDQRYGPVEDLTKAHSGKRNTVYKSNKEDKKEEVESDEDIESTRWTLTK